MQKRTKEEEARKFEREVIKKREQGKEKKDVGEEINEMEKEKRGGSKKVAAVAGREGNTNRGRKERSGGKEGRRGKR